MINFSFYCLQIYLHTFLKIVITRSCIAQNQLSVSPSVISLELLNVSDIQFLVIQVAEVFSSSMWCLYDMLNMHIEFSPDHCIYIWYESSHLLQSNAEFIGNNKSHLLQGSVSHSCLTQTGDHPSQVSIHRLESCLLHFPLDPFIRCPKKLFTPLLSFSMS